MVHLQLAAVHRHLDEHARLWGLIGSPEAHLRYCQAFRTPGAPQREGWKSKTTACLGSGERTEQHPKIACPLSRSLSSPFLLSKVG